MEFHFFFNIVCIRMSLTSLATNKNHLQLPAVCRWEWSTILILMRFSCCPDILLMPPAPAGLDSSLSS